jgi:Na+/H+-dicarboxylate symporter
MKGQNFGFAVGIAQRKHGPSVLALFKTIQNSSTNSTGWGIWFGPFRKSGLQFFQFAKQGIKFLVANQWLILDIVCAVVFVELADQFLDPELR